MSVILKFNNQIHDTFLHVSPSLYIKIIKQFIPLIKLDGHENVNLTFWCVQNSLLENESAQLNSKIAEHLGLKNGLTYNISFGICKHVDLSKVIVSVPSGPEDLTFLHENFKIIESLILDQIRLVRRGDLVPIFTNHRNKPLWIKIEEFGGYQTPEKVGIIGNDTELIVMEEFETISQTENLVISKLVTVPSSNFVFSANPCQKLPQICSFKGYNFKVEKDENIPIGILVVPDVILHMIFELLPKDIITLNHNSCDDKTDENCGFKHFSTDGLLCEFDRKLRRKETIIPTSNGIVVKTKHSDSEEIIQFKKIIAKTFNKFSEILSKSSSRLILFHGPAGCGKSETVNEAIAQLNYSYNFLLPIIYSDLTTIDKKMFLLQTQKSKNNNHLLILDHVDEYLKSDSDEADDKNAIKYMKLCHLISNIIEINKRSKIVLIVRSIKSLSRFFSISSLPVDKIFSLEESKNWKFNCSVSSDTYLNFHGLDEAKSLLERYILNPMRFSDVFRANRMNLHSGILITGPSGSGKTFLAQQFINQYKIPCITVRGPEILDKYVGASERGVRDLFSKARQIRPCLIFFDEIDSLIPMRGSNQSGVTDRIVNQFLTELDGTEDRSGIFVIGTTSRPDVIDKAILRPGRIDQRIDLYFPTTNDIKKFISEKNGLETKKFKVIFDFLKTNSQILLSWADLKSIDWSISDNNTLSDLIKSIQSKNKIIQEKSDLIKEKSQKLVLI